MPEVQSVCARLTVRTAEGDRIYQIELAPAGSGTFYHRNEKAGFRLILEKLDPLPLEEEVGQTSKEDAQSSVFLDYLNEKAEQAKKLLDPPKPSERVVSFLPIKKRDIQEEVKKIMTKY